MINDNEVYKRKCVLSILEPNLTSLASNCTVLANDSGSDSIIALRWVYNTCNHFSNTNTVSFFAVLFFRNVIKWSVVEGRGQWGLTGTHYVLNNHWSVKVNGNSNRVNCARLMYVFVYTLYKKSTFYTIYRVKYQPKSL